MTMGTLVLHRYNGDEVFALKSATVAAGALGLTLEIDASSPPLSGPEDTQSLFAYPNAEVSVDFAHAGIHDLANQRFNVPFGFDKESEDWIGRFCYVEHDDLNNNIIEISEIQDDCVFVRWTGTTTDVVHYDGSKPDTQIEIVGWFKYDRAVENTSTVA